MTDTEKLEAIKKELKGCIENEKECLDTKYEADAKKDNWYRLRNNIPRILKGNWS